MDLSKVLDTAETGAVLKVKHPSTGETIKNDDGSDLTITLAGIDSARWRKGQDSIGDRRLKAATPRGGSSSYKSMGEAREDQVFLLANATLSWNGVELEGKAIECTLDNAKMVYSHPNLGWLVEQVDRFIADRTNFSTASLQI
jgi:hypothetical protein